MVELKGYGVSHTPSICGLELDNQFAWNYNVTKVSVRPATGCIRQWVAGDSCLETDTGS